MLADLFSFGMDVRYWVVGGAHAVFVRHVLYRFNLLILDLEVLGSMVKSLHGWATLAMTPPN